MKRKIFPLILLCSFSLFTACNNDEDEMEHEHNDELTEFDYHAQILSPNADDKHVGDTIHLHVDFESHTGETVHHVNVKIYNKADSTQVIYDAPGNAHVHATEGEFGYHDDLPLTAETGVSAHSDWILEARVWGHEAGKGEVVESIEFHVHPE